MKITGIGPRFYERPGAPVRKIADNDEGQLLLRLVSERLSEVGADHVYSTGRVGFDMVVAWAAMSLGVPYTIIQPYEGWGVHWTDEERAYYEQILNGASRVETLSKGRPTTAKLKRADKAVVERADTVLTLWDGRHQSRTFDSIYHAYSTRTEVDNLWNDFVRSAAQISL